jgi:hypothetical protein
MVKVLSSPSPVLPSASMSQSGLMVAALLGGFVVFLAMQGKLQNYWSILLGGGASSTATTGTTTAPATTTAPGATTTSPTPTTSLFGLPSSIFPMLGGTANPTAPATGGTGTATPTGVPGLPNTSLGTFFGLGSG